MITIKGGTSARCAALTKGELYVALLYNTSPHAQSVDVTVVWSNDVPPGRVTLQSTTNDQGPAGMIFVSGEDTEFLTLSIGVGSTATVEALMVSVSMPANTNGITAETLPADGQFHSFPKFTRYCAVPPEGWSALTVQNLSTQFISVQMRREAAVVRVNRSGPTPLYDGQLSKFGKTAKSKNVVQLETSGQSTFTDDRVKGNGTRWVWISADSTQNSSDAKIALQSLSFIRSLVATSAQGLSRLFRGAPD
ncbi:hypothetical protein ACN2XU_14735 [Primorskyibacter sp. 2E107]|uniref:hypothetical protein n=1 Tax=Primorskyibacter sp. 2E107 TaxID=3403458 RepID=UPI003AF85F9D